MIIKYLRNQEERKREREKDKKDDEQRKNVSVLRQYIFEF